MNYDLTKQLKDAGLKFPSNDGCSNCWGDLGKGCSDECGRERFPTLSELIEACGDDFRSLKKVKNGAFSWCASSKGQDIYDKTAEESVANLYLVLHKK